MCYYNEYGQDIIILYELENELQQQPMYVLDKVSDQKQSFSVIMDLVFSKLKLLRKCGYTVSLFPGSFSREAGITILASKKCLEIFEKYSSLDEYFLAYQHRYKMHRLIMKYLKEKTNSSDEILFEKRFSKYYTQFLLNYAIESELNNVDEHILSSESKNIDMLIKYILSSSQGNFSTEELAALAFLVSKGYIQIERLQSNFRLYLINLNYMSDLLSPVIHGELVSHIVKHFYSKCACDTLTEYVQKIYEYPCTDIFNCKVITELLKMESFLNISERKKDFLYNIQIFKCFQINKSISYLIAVCIIGFFCFDSNTSFLFKTSFST